MDGSIDWDQLKQDEYLHDAQLDEQEEQEQAAAERDGDDGAAEIWSVR